jgi:hypothetical protein
MSVLVKDMRFPNYCSDCEFSKPWGNNGTYCSRYLWKDDVKYGEGKPDWCPLKYVPTPHGKLIDKDKLLSQFREMSLDDLSLAEDFIEHGIDDILNDAPTIIEAEE